MTRSEVAAEAAEAGAPHTFAPTEVTNAEVATRTTIDSTPEEHSLAFPLLRNEMWVGEEVVQNVRRQYHNTILDQFREERIPLVNPFLSCHLFLGEVERFFLLLLVPRE